MQQILHEDANEFYDHCGRRIDSRYITLTKTAEHKLNVGPLSEVGCAAGDAADVSAQWNQTWQDMNQQMLDTLNKEPKSFPQRQNVDALLHILRASAPLLSFITSTVCIFLQVQTTCH